MVISRSAMQSSLTAPRLVARNRAAAVEKAVQRRDAHIPTNTLFQRFPLYWFQTEA